MCLNIGCNEEITSCKIRFYYRSILYRQNMCLNDCTNCMILFCSYSDSFYNRANCVSREKHQFRVTVGLPLIFSSRNIYMYLFAGMMQNTETIRFLYACDMVLFRAWCLIPFTSDLSNFIFLAQESNTRHCEHMSDALL